MLRLVVNFIRLDLIKVRSPSNERWINVTNHSNLCTVEPLENGLFNFFRVELLWNSIYVQDIDFQPFSCSLCLNWGELFIKT